MTFKELCGRLKSLPEIDLLEVLEITSDDLVDRFEDFIENKRSYFEEDLELDDVFKESEDEY